MHDLHASLDEHSFDRVRTGNDFPRAPGHVLMSPLGIGRAHVAVSGCVELDGPTAQAWFDRLPRPLRLRSLSPDFAQADVRREPGLRCVHVGYREGEACWLHSAHWRVVPGFGWAALSPYGYGGPLASDADPSFLQRAWSAYVEWARGRQLLGEFCRFHPEAGQEVFFGGAVLANRATISVALDREPLTEQYDTLARRKLRRSAAVPVRWSRAAADWAVFGGFYREAMAAMGAHPRYHFGDDYFQALAALPGVELCLCGPGDAWLSAGVYLFQQPARPDAAGGGTVEYHLGASNAAGHALGTAYLMQHAAAREGRRRGLLNLYLGGGTGPEADNPLLFHKRCFSRRERTFHIGRVVYDAPGFESYARSRGFDPASAPPNLLFD